MHAAARRTSMAAEAKNPVTDSSAPHPINGLGWPHSDAASAARPTCIAAEANAACVGGSRRRMAGCFGAAEGRAVAPSEIRVACFFGKFFRVFRAGSQALDRAYPVNTDTCYIQRPARSMPWLRWADCGPNAAATEWVFRASVVGP